MGDRKERTHWERPRFESGGGDAFVFYIVFGTSADELELSTSKYRTRGLPEGVQAWNENPRRYDDLLGGYIGRVLDNELPEAVASVRRSSKCVVVKGQVADPSTLDYLRDTIGVVTALLDRGGALLDAQSFRLWTPASWRRDVFERDAASPGSHVTILESEDDRDRIWVHTRGLRKFGRPDLSIRGVAPSLREAVHELFNRFIEFQAFGGVIAEGAPVRMKSLPEGLTCHHGGSLEDPEFNNVHVEVRGLVGASSG
jgi:hypothetical protein